jgi:hypothetical protein
MLAYAVLLGALGVLFVAAAGALRDGIRHGGRLRGILVSLAAMLLSLFGLWALLV